MGLFGGAEKVKSFDSKISDLKTKIAQLESAGMVASAERLKKELKRYDHVMYEKTKALSPAEMKATVKAYKAEGKIK
jgi:tRNA-binding EMAP/Myf-like protein